MRKIIFMGRSECGKTTLMQALRGDKIQYHKTQYINNFDLIIDTPGEYAETNKLARALALYAYEADVVGLLLSSIEPYSLYPPCCTACCSRPVIGIVTQIDRPNGDPDRAYHWLDMAGCHPIYKVSSYTGEGLWQIFEYLREPGDVLPWESQEEAERPRTVISDKYGRVKP